MTCEQRRDLMPLYVADALESAEREELRRHLAAGCVACAGALAEARATFAALPLALDPVAVPPGLLDRVIDRIDQTDRTDRTNRTDRTDRTTAAGPVPARPASFRLGWLLPTAAAAAAAVAVTYAAVVRRDRVALANAVSDARLTYNADARATLLQAALADRDQTLDQLRRRVAEQQQVVDALRSPGAQVVPLAGVTQAGASARLVWAPGAGRSVLLAEHLTPSPPGRAYELWFITADQRKVPAATFAVDAGGSATLAAPIPSGLGPLAVAAVTDEPSAGSPAPTGQIQLAGKAP